MKEKTSSTACCDDRTGLTRSCYYYQTKTKSNLHNQHSKISSAEWAR